MAKKNKTDAPELPVAAPAAQADAPATAPVEAGVEAVAVEATAAPADLRARLKDLEKTAREAAKKRFAGTRAEKALEEIPGKVERVEKELEARLDQVLDKVGLVRKSRIVASPADKPEVAPTSQAA